MFSYRRMSKVAVGDMASFCKCFLCHGHVKLIYLRFRDPNHAREALEKMNGFDLAGRPIRVGLGIYKSTSENQALQPERNPYRRASTGSESSTQEESFNSGHDRTSWSDKDDAEIMPAEQSATQISKQRWENRMGKQVRLQP